jgi:DNA-binding transcriptional LysR family regulator
MEIRHLQHFVALAEEGSFTRAAQRMHIVQSGLSASIKELEAELGSRLVERTTRRVALTETGRLFLDHARATLRAMEEGVTAVRSQDGVVRGRLRLGTLQSMGPYLELPLLLKRFRAAYPEVEIAVRALTTDAIPGLVASGDVDLSFHALVNRREWPGVEVIRYVEDSLVAVCSVDYAERRGGSVNLTARKTGSVRLTARKMGSVSLTARKMGSVSLTALAEETFVDLSPDRALRRVVDGMFAEHRVKRNTVFEVSDVQTALQFVEKDMGVAVVPSALARQMVAERRIRVLRISDEEPRPPAWRIAILRRVRQRGLGGKSTVDLFLEALAGMPRVSKSVAGKGKSVAGKGWRMGG